MITPEELLTLKTLLSVTGNTITWNSNYKMHKRGDIVNLFKPFRFHKHTLSARYLLNYLKTGIYGIDKELYPENTKISSTITHEQLLKVLKYDVDLGIFTYKESRGNRAAGATAGYTHGTGYKYIELGGKAYSEHRLAWFYCFNRWPINDIDHIDRDPSNNKLSNLREATTSENMRNRSIGVNNTSGFLGVSLYKPTGKWRATFVLNGKAKHIGYYDTPEEANEAYQIFKDNN